MEVQLQKIKNQYETLETTANLLGPNYASAFIGNLLYTALPIYASASIVIWMMFSLGGFSRSSVFNVLLYATIGVVGAKTRFWVNERRKKRSIWKSILILLLTVPIILGMVVFVFWAIGQYV
jgi:hypothetical protein